MQKVVGAVDLFAPEQAAKDLLKGIEKGLSGEKLLAFARRSLKEKET
jgi:hypothetical protein